MTFDPPWLPRRTGLPQEVHRHYRPAHRVPLPRTGDVTRNSGANHPAVTITVAQSAVAAVLKGGGHLGPCTGSEKPRTHLNGSTNGLGKGKGASAGTTTTTESGQGNAPGAGHGNKGSG
jgi:hypothetical protein